MPSDELDDVLHRPRHRHGGGAGIKRHYRFPEVEAAINGFEIGVRGKQRRVIGTTERQESAQPPLEPSCAAIESSCARCP